MLVDIDAVRAELLVAVRSSGEQSAVTNDERRVRTLRSDFGVMHQR
jgi:hypothetical protein